MNTSPFTQFAFALAREHALNTLQPERMFLPPPLPEDPAVRQNIAAAIQEEQFTEGRRPRYPGRTNFKE